MIQLNRWQQNIYINLCLVGPLLVSWYSELILYTPLVNYSELIHTTGTKAFILTHSIRRERQGISTVCVSGCI
jgi:hypothetical protein